jgi:hypothetical protein
MPQAETECNISAITALSRATQGRPVLTEGAAVVYATVGATTLQGLVFLERLRGWQAARVAARAKKESLPALPEFVDAPADLLVAGFCIGLGALGGWLLSSEISGVPLALVAGAAAPELLAHLCRSTSLMNILLRDAPDQVQPAHKPALDADEEQEPESAKTREPS